MAAGMMASVTSSISCVSWPHIGHWRTMCASRWLQPEHSTEAGNAAGIPLGLTDRYPGELFASLIERLAQNAASLFSNLIVGDATEVHWKMTEQPLFHVRVQLAFELVPTDVVASNNGLLIEIFFKSCAQMLGHALEVMHGFVVDSTFEATCGVRITATVMSRGRVKYAFALFEFVHAKIEEARLLPIDECDAQARLRAQKQSKRLQVELATDEQMRFGELQRQIELAPEIAAAAGKHRAGAGLIAVKIFRQFENAIQVCAGASVFSVLFGLTQGFANQIFGENGFFAMRFVLRGTRFEIKAEGRTFVPIGVELSQLTHVFAGNHYDCS